MTNTERQAKWDAANTTQVKMKLCKSTDADVLQWLENQPSKQGAIKELIRQQIEKEKSLGK